MKILPRKTSLACLLALVALAPSGFSFNVEVPFYVRDPSNPFCGWFGGTRHCSPDTGGFFRVFAAQDSCGDQHLILIDENKGELLAQHALEPGEELEEVVSVTPREITIKVNASNTDALLALFQTYLSDNPTPGVIEAQVVTASSHFPELQFGTPSRAAAFDRWYEEVYAGVLPEPSERLRTYRIVKAEKRLAMTQERIFEESDPEKLVVDGNARLTPTGPGGSSRAKRAYYTAEVENDGTTLELRRYVYKTAERWPPR